MSAKIARFVKIKLLILKGLSQNLGQNNILRKSRKKPCNKSGQICRNCNKKFYKTSFEKGKSSSTAKSLTYTFQISVGSNILVF